jgi:hypothetical protein
MIPYSGWGGQLLFFRLRGGQVQSIFAEEGHIGELERVLSPRRGGQIEKHGEAEDDHDKNPGFDYA